jgi:hypothetical protein
MLSTAVGTLIYGDEEHDRVYYQPPKSVAYGHASRIRNARVAWPVTIEFFERFTIYQISPRISLSCQQPGKYINEDIAINRIKTARDIFGPETNPSCTEWQLTNEQLSMAIDFVLDDDKFPRQKPGSVRLYFSYTFFWRDFLVQPLSPGDKVFIFDRIIKDQWNHLGTDPLCSMGIHLGSRRLFIQPAFVFPFPYDSRITIDFLARIEESLPFRFRDQYFKRMIRSNKGTYGKMRKLPKGWRQVNPENI